MNRSRATARAVDTFAALAESPDALAAVAAETVRAVRVAAVRRALRVANDAFDQCDRHRQDGSLTTLREYVAALETLKEATEVLVAEDEDDG